VFPISRSTEKLSLRRDLKGIRPRARRDLPFIGVTAAPGGPLMLDTGVYIHGLKGQTPTALRSLLRLRTVHHSVVAMQEILHAIGVLDPAHPETAKNVAAIRALLDGIPLHRLYTPDRDVLIDAAIVAGILCRLRGYARDRRTKALHDCTLLLHAARTGCTLLTANVSDFDLLQQLKPESRVIFYEAA
jgi:predicted nucleic acid-binding protein